MLAVSPRCSLIGRCLSALRLAGEHLRTCPQDYTCCSSDMEEALLRQSEADFRGAVDLTSQFLLTTFTQRHRKLDARALVQGLATGRDLVGRAAKLTPTPECKRALMRLSYCPLCRGLPSLKPCHSFCRNVMKGCLANQADLDTEWNSFIGLLALCNAVVILFLCSVSRLRAGLNVLVLCSLSLACCSLLSLLASALTQGLERIPDQLGYLVIRSVPSVLYRQTKSAGLGYLVISEDGVLASAGELENDEQAAGLIMQMVQTACRFRLHDGTEPPFKRLSVVFEDHAYMVTVSGRKVFVVKRHNNQRDPVIA
ncbi:UNVERIFIED_CONTAM: hypothetical protein FKN15_014935 [Acipenser sinensis]